MKVENLTSWITLFPISTLDFRDGGTVLMRTIHVVVMKVEMVISTQYTAILLR